MVMAAPRSGGVHVIRGCDCRDIASLRDDQPDEKAHAPRFGAKYTNSPAEVGRICDWTTGFIEQTGPFGIALPYLPKTSSPRSRQG
jgi:hypothetical protein